MKTSKSPRNGTVKVRTNPLLRWLRSQPGYKTFRRLVRARWFARVYLVLSLTVLILSTIFWSLLGAKLQASNADQLVDPYLFESGATFHDAVFPGSHSFLLKWPLFMLIRFLGFTPNAYLVVTVCLVLATVLALAYLLYRIDRRPLYFATLVLALASVLLLVPAQPYAGGILPVNLAMLATRNIEYVLFLAGLVAIVRSPRFRSWQFYAAVLGMGILFASDKLFLAFGLLSAAVTLMLYSLTQSIKLINLAAYWLLVSVVAAIVAFGILAVVHASGLTNIDSEAAAPYALVHSINDLLLGIFYAVMGILTNIGANPAYDATIIQQVPSHAISRLLSTSGPAYVVNFALLGLMLGASWQQMRANFTKRGRKSIEKDAGTKLSLMLIVISLVATGLFVIADHYYAVDARYVAVVLFAGFVALAVQHRKKRYQPDTLVLAGLVLLAGIMCAVPSVINSYRFGAVALSSDVTRNNLVNKALNIHPVDTLVGDYWRVVPIKNTSNKDISILPLADCTTPRKSLSSRAWQKNLSTHSFAYVLTLDRSSTDFPSCSVEQVTRAYGHPNTSLLIAGTYDQPKEVLLFYDHGARPDKLNQSTANITPIGIDVLPYTGCLAPTIMNIVAHQDDDLLFLSPDLEHSITAGNCVRTVYITAGDSGYGQFYWTNRQRGAEAAYSQLIGSKQVWVQRVIKLAKDRFVTVSNPRGNPRVSLIFMNLPDGDLMGNGFSTSNFGSLEKLRDNRIDSMKSVDGQSVSTSSQLVDDLTTLMQAYQPSEIRTHSDISGQVLNDHSDHLAVKWFATQAYTEYETRQFNNQVVIPIKYYRGYPVRELPTNVTGEDLSKKEFTFLAYSKFDGSVCSSIALCHATPTYGEYLGRQYIQEP